MINIPKKEKQFPIYFEPFPQHILQMDVTLGRHLGPSLLSVEIKVIRSHKINIINLNEAESHLTLMTLKFGLRLKRCILFLLSHFILLIQVYPVALLFFPFKATPNPTNLDKF